MSQDVWSTINPSTTSGTQLATLLNSFKDAMMSGLKGPSRPTQLVSSGLWVDDTLEGSNILTLKLYDGVQDITLFSINKATGSATAGSAESLFEILKTSDDTVGAKLKLRKKRSTGNQTMTNDVIGEVLFYGTLADNTDTVMARIYSTSQNDVTLTEQGSFLVFEATDVGAAAAVEVMRIIDSKVGIGTATPEETLHVKGTAIKAEKASDDTVGAKVKLHKKRVTGNGGVQSGDNLAEILIESRTATGSNIEVAKIISSATENHTSSAHGSQLSFSTKDNGGTTYIERFLIDENGMYIPVLNTLNEVTVNKGSTQANANGNVAGFKVEMSDATHARIGYDSTKATKFKVGLVGSEVGIVDESTAQPLTNKAISNVTKLEAKKGTLSALTTYASTAGDGEFCFATDVGRMYYTYGNTLKELEQTMIANGGTTVTVTDLDTTVDNNSAPSNAIGFFIQADENNGVNLRFALGSSVATTTNGTKLLPGVTSDTYFYTGVVSVIAESGSSKAYTLQWLTRS